MNYDSRWYYDNPRNAYQREHNRYYEWRRTGGRPPSALSQADSQRWRYELAGVPILGDFIRASDNTAWMNDYLKYHQMTWADVKYPGRASGAGSSARAISNAGEAFLQGSLLRRMYRRLSTLPVRHKDINQELHDLSSVLKGGGAPRGGAPSQDTQTIRAALGFPHVPQFLKISK